MANLKWLSALLFIYSLMWQKSYSKANLYSFLVDHSGDLWIEPVKLASTKAEEDPSGDASDFMMAEEVVDLTAGTNVYTFGQFSLSFDISLLLVLIFFFFLFQWLIYQRNILNSRCLPLPVGIRNIAGPSTKINIFTWFWPSFPK
ncbi:hypothetical protein D0Y65_054511 [Glycine soja]|uniref:Uncharacterized protein n=1 Tax=Glycine soja TaxID=3848 RepID=A0A445F717_GLYSO|nr:hypothetical protein D0Y65_054511 [Glycine soja]